MKKQIAVSALGLLTLAGGSWLAAQQRESLRTTRSSDTAVIKEVAATDDGDDDYSRTKEDVEKPRSASAASPQRSQRARASQDARGAADLYREDVARHSEAARAFNEFAVDQHFSFPGMPQRMTPEDAARMREFQDAIRELREAESAEDKAAAREQVTRLVSEQLEADLENREKELTEIEQRAKELRKQLEERKTAKPELLKMLVMLIDNPQVGLGIPPDWIQLLMRRQPDQYRLGFPVNGAFGRPAITPAAPPQPTPPPAAIRPFDNGGDILAPAEPPANRY